MAQSNTDVEDDDGNGRLSQGGGGRNFLSSGVCADCNLTHTAMQLYQWVGFRTLRPRNSCDPRRSLRHARRRRLSASQISSPKSSTSEFKLRGCTCVGETRLGIGDARGAHATDARRGGSFGAAGLVNSKFVGCWCWSGEQQVCGGGVGVGLRRLRWGRVGRSA